MAMNMKSTISFKFALVVNKNSERFLLRNFKVVNNELGSQQNRIFVKQAVLL